MPDTMTSIADKVRGVAQEKRTTQEAIARFLGLSRDSVSQRYQGRIPFTGPELHRLASEWNVPISRLFPDPQTTHAPEATPPAVSAARVPSTPIRDAVPDPGDVGGGIAASASATGVGAEDSSAA